MLKKYYELLLRFHKRKTDQKTKVISLSLGVVFFLIILPGIFFFIASLFRVSWEISNPLKNIVSFCSILFGLSFLIWATYSQLAIGRGTPVPNAPTQKLVVTGPYHYTRNPIEFGALFYYFGVGTFFGSLFHGMITLFLGCLVGSIYHKLIEEKELLLRFGKDYEDYRKRTPFLIPRWWKNKSFADKAEDNHD